MKGLIYMYTNKINNKKYIGETIHEEIRKQTHFFAQDNTKFHKALRYYGWINFDYVVLEKDIDEEDLPVREKYWIDYYNTKEEGYNMDDRKTMAMAEKKYMLKQSKYHLTCLTFGYEHRNKDGKIYINEHKAEIVRNIFSDYISHKYSMKELKEKYGRRYTNIIKNEIYLGTDIYPQIIDKETFEKAKELRTNKVGKKHLTRHKFLLEGKFYHSISEAIRDTGYYYNKIVKNATFFDS